MTGGKTGRGGLPGGGYSGAGRRTDGGREGDVELRGAQGDLQVGRKGRGEVRTGGMEASGAGVAAGAAHRLGGAVEKGFF
jgi:hypothetical protein